jgi:hypothetical protein
MIKNKKKTTSDKKAKPKTIEKASKSKTAKTHKSNGNGNEYESWTGAAETSGRELFDTKTREREDISEFPEIDHYLPPVSKKGLVHFFVARVATTSKKSHAKKEVVKLFVNKSWDDNVLAQLENMDFTKVGNNLDRLVSDVKLQIDTGGEWKIDSYVEIFRDLDPPGRPTAKVVFTSKKTGRLLSGFWCW